MVSERKVDVKVRKSVCIKGWEVEIIQLHHDILVIKYSGRWKTMELVTRNY